MVALITTTLAAPLLGDIAPIAGILDAVVSQFNKP